MADPQITLHHATTAADLAAVRTLCWEYRDFLLNNSGTDRDITLTFYPEAKYRALLDDLEVLHARPEGIILLACLDDVPVGCGMTHGLDPQSAEIKRVFVRDSARGKGIAKQICIRLMDQARADGYARVLLDTSAALRAAQALYLRLGFAPRGPYQDIPPHVLPHLRFFEMTL